MIVKSVKLRNIRSYLNEYIEFPSGSLLLNGDIGSGKSTILLAIEFSLFGVIRGDVDGSLLLRHGRNTGYVEVTFEIDRHSVVIHRALRRNKTSVSQEAGYIIIDGLKTDCTPLELKARVLDLLGYPKSLLTKSKSLIYRYTVYTPQEEMKHILFEDSAARLDTLRKVFQIDSYKTIRDNTTVVLHSIKEKIVELSAKTEDIGIKQKQVEDFQKQLAASQSSLQLVTPLLKDNAEKFMAQKQLLKQCEANLQASNTIKTELSAYEALLAEKNRSLTATNQEIEQLSLQIKDCNSVITNSTNAAADFSSNLASLNHHVSLLSKELEAKQTTDSDIEALQNKLLAVVSDITRAETTILESKKLEKNVLLSASCPVCLQPISEQHKTNFRTKISSEFSSSESLIVEKTQEKQTLNSQLSSTKEKFSSLLEKERKFTELSTLAKQFSTVAGELGVQKQFGEKPRNIEEVIHVLSSASKLLNEKLKTESSIKEKTAQLDLLNERLAATSIGVEEVSKKITSAKVSLQKYVSLDSDFHTIKMRLDKLQQQEKELLVKKAAFDKEIENHNSNLLLLRQEITIKQTHKKTLEHSLELKNWLDEFFINLMYVIEKNIMLKVYNEFNALFQGWFNILMEEESISARLDDTFTPIVEVNGYEMPLANLSGGEKTSCALAYRLALNKVINDVVSTIKTKDLLILDEPTDGFSSQQLEKVRDVLEQLNLPQVIIVSHESKIESFVQHVLRVVKEQHVSHVIA